MRLFVNWKPAFSLHKRKNTFNRMFFKSLLSDEALLCSIVECVLKPTATVFIYAGELRELVLLEPDGAS